MSSGIRVDWNALLAKVRADFPEVYRNWFEELQPLETSGPELVVRVDSVPKTRYLQETCTRAFVDSAMVLTGMLVSIRFRCVNERQAVVSDAAVLTQLPLNPDYTFDEFVVGDSNRFAHAAAMSVCAQPGTLYNPLFVHGRSGLGKTHLLQALCSRLRDQGLYAVYLTSDVFINDFVRALENGRLQEFRESLRRAAVLVLDDAQFLAGHETSQEELFHTFNTLHQSRRQMVISADATPGEIPTLKDRLVSRLQWGLIVPIELPNRETRQAILQRKARLRGCTIPNPVLDYLAERIETNIRLLEGALTRLISETQFSGKPLTIDTAREIVSSLEPQPTRSLMITDILEAVSTHFGLRPAELVGRKRSRSISHPRQIGMYLARQLTPLSLEEIGLHFGGRDHSTVLHAERVVAASRRHDAETAEALTILTRRLSSKPPDPAG